MSLQGRRGSLCHDFPNQQIIATRNGLDLLDYDSRPWVHAENAKRRRVILEAAAAITPTEIADDSEQPRSEQDIVVVEDETTSGDDFHHGAHAPSASPLVAASVVEDEDGNVDDEHDFHRSSGWLFPPVVDDDDDGTPSCCQYTSLVSVAADDSSAGPPVVETPQKTPAAGQKSVFDIPLKLKSGCQFDVSQSSTSAQGRRKAVKWQGLKASTMPRQLAQSCAKSPQPLARDSTSMT